MIATHLQPRLHAGEQEGRHTSKKSRLLHPPLELFQPKILSKTIHHQFLLTYLLTQAHIVSPVKSLKVPSIMHQSSSRMKPNLLTSLPAPQPEKIKQREYIDLNSLISAHMFAPLSTIEPSYQLNLSYKSALLFQPTAAKSKDYQP